APLMGRARRPARKLGADRRGSGNQARVTVRACTAMSKRTKRRGHFCWCCGRIRPNEMFSGRGHARHLCRDCAKLGAGELAYRQMARDIDRLVDWNGVVRRKQRKSFERFLSHPDKRVRAYAAEVAARDVSAREAFRQERLAEEAMELAWGERGA